MKTKFHVKYLEDLFIMEKIQIKFVYIFFPKITPLTDIYICLSVNDTRRQSQYKGKAIPLQAWTCPEGSRKLRLPDFKTNSTRT